MHYHDTERNAILAIPSLRQQTLKRTHLKRLRHQGQSESRLHLYQTLRNSHRSTSRTHSRRAQMHYASYSSAFVVAANPASCDVMHLQRMMLLLDVSCYNEAVCQRRYYIGDNCREIKARKEENLQEGGERDALKERKTRRKRTYRKLGLGMLITLVEEPPKTTRGEN